MISKLSGIKGPTGISSKVSKPACPSGRAFRSLGQLIDDPLDNFIGRRELRRLRKQMDQLSDEEWAIFPKLFYADLCVKRVIECVRYVSIMIAVATK